MHIDGPQLVPDATKRHEPFPSQVPSCPQAIVSTAHLPLDDPPAVIGLQRPPGWPVSAVAHDEQSPVHAVSQQMPATH
jgi:hypothetical protein